MVHAPAMLEVTGSRLSFSVISWKTRLVKILQNARIGGPTESVEEFGCLGSVI